MKIIKKINLVLQRRKLRIKNAFLKIYYSKNKSKDKFDWNWNKSNFNRISLVNYLLSKKNKDAKYLEIGCDDNVLFNAVACRYKIGVDPHKGGTHRMTSDNFFEKNETKFDVIFIDGLHEYSQVMKDAINSIKFLNKDGFIAFHDFLPKNWIEAHVPRLNITWNGDIWKLAFNLIESNEIDFKILLIDRGICVLKLKKNRAKINQNSFVKEKFQYLFDNISKLPLIDIEAGLDWIDSQN